VRSEGCQASPVGRWKIVCGRKDAVRRAVSATRGRDREREGNTLIPSHLGYRTWCRMYVPQDTTSCLSNRVPGHGAEVPWRIGRRVVASGSRGRDPWRKETHENNKVSHVQEALACNYYCAGDKGEKKRANARVTAYPEIRTAQAKPAVQIHACVCPFLVHRGW